MNQDVKAGIVLKGLAHLGRVLAVAFAPTTSADESPGLGHLGQSRGRCPHCGKPHGIGGCPHCKKAAAVGGR